MDLEKINKQYQELLPIDRIRQLYADFDPKDILVTSSFGTSSVYMLNLLRQVNKDQTVYFIDTTYHFNETLEYREKLGKLLGLEIVDVRPNPVDNSFTTRNETWKTDPDFCCNINKVLPLEELKKKHKVWVSGLMQFQSDFREQRPVFEQNGILKFYPVIDVSAHDVRTYIKGNHLPAHPLADRGFESIGCIQCTMKGRGRTGRWSSFRKTECGLHT